MASGTDLVSRRPPPTYIRRAPMKSRVTRESVIDQSRLTRNSLPSSKKVRAGLKFTLDDVDPEQQ